MDLKTIDTADGIERAEGSSLCTALCNYVYDALKDKDYCCKDPFGEVRCGNRRINICYVSGEAANITHVLLAICLNNMLFADNKRGMTFCWTDMYDDVMAAAKQAAAKHSARVFAPKQVLGTVPRIQTSWPSMSKNAYSNAKPDSLPRVEKTYVAKFSFAFYRTSYYADKDIPDSKIIWDAFCRQREEHFRLHKADKAIMQPVYKLKYSDYGRLFSYIETTYCIKGIDKNSLSIGVSLRQMDGKEPGKTVEWPFNRVEEILRDIEDSMAADQHIESGKEEEAMFYKNKQVIQRRLDEEGIDIVYREMFDFCGCSYVITAIHPKARKHVFTAICLDDDEGKEKAHKKAFGWELLRIISAHRFTD